MQETVRENIAREKKKYKMRYDENKNKNVTYAMGQIVFAKRNPEAMGM